ncbi:MAG: class I SAM-dependent methyltransferase [Cyanothece sp. SIO1E1]|nr:class I SAM-dependent methyltransferase [Cyanothece sp. SIO1E1]
MSQNLEPTPEQQKIQLMVEQAGGKANPSGWFESLYAAAGNDAAQVPWATLTPNLYLEDWLEHHLSEGKGQTALVIGCGLGDDAEALAKRGFSVTAFDISSTAIAWCQQRFPNSQVNYVVADLLALEPAWHRRFDFVFESITIQALPIRVRCQVMEAIAQLVANSGTLLVITYTRETDAEPNGPPWPLTENELAYFQQLGLQEIRCDAFSNQESKFGQRLRVEYRFAEIQN